MDVEQEYVEQENKNMSYYLLLYLLNIVQVVDEKTNVDSN